MDEQGSDFHEKFILHVFAHFWAKLFLVHVLMGKVHIYSISPSHLAIN